MRIERVRDLMHAPVFTVRPDDDLATVRDLMDDHGVRHVPVIDEDGALVGIVSHRDLLRAALIERPDLPELVERELLERTRVAAVMTPYVETIGPEAELSEAARMLREARVGALPVTDNDRLVGILTEADFVGTFAAAS